jgi:hypothetical protein
MDRVAMSKQMDSIARHGGADFIAEYSDGSSTAIKAFLVPATGVEDNQPGDGFKKRVTIQAPVSQFIGRLPTKGDYLKDGASKRFRIIEPVSIYAAWPNLTFICLDQ